MRIDRNATSIVAHRACPVAVERCNGLDDDCRPDTADGVDDPRVAIPCDGPDADECEEGTSSCAGGMVSCDDATGDDVEACNDVDDDCDGLDDVAEGLVDTDLFNCGACGNVCMLANAFAACVGGSCELVTCQAGFFDVDGLPGCEYACTFAGAESCNGNDDDCDGLTDEDVIGPDFDATSLCGALGVCATGTARCDGAAGIVCDLPTTFEVTETTCDGLDNDCDGDLDLFDDDWSSLLSLTPASFIIGQHIRFSLFSHHSTRLAEATNFHNRLSPCRRDVDR